MTVSESSGLLNEREAAEYLGLSVSTLRQDRCRPSLGIPYCRFGRAIRYRIESLEAFAAQNEHGVPAEPVA